MFGRCLHSLTPADVGEKWKEDFFEAAYVVRGIEIGACADYTGMFFVFMHIINMLRFVQIS